jgi:PelA/Pel-15E family pectate lyase
MKNISFESCFNSILYLILSLTFINCAAQTNIGENQIKIVDTTEFNDSAHHWYDINDEAKIIEPLPEQKRYSTSEVKEIADNILLFQKSNGGWPKNYDMRAILTEEQKKAVLKTKNDLNTTFDNGATHSQLNYLAKAYSLTKIEKYKDAFMHGIDYVLFSQYENGGWPQFYPDKKGYRKYITFNDGAMIGIMTLLSKISNQKEEFPYIQDSLYIKINLAFKKGIECILNCQIQENGKLSAWCQQHDNVDFHPQNARSFEPAAICNGESCAIVKFLMSIVNPDKRVIKSVTSAVKWFEDSRIYGIRVEEIKADKVDYIYHITEYDKVVVEDSEAKPIWTRYYEIGTHKPMFCNRDGKVVYTLNEVERERRTGYAWYVYDPQEVLDLYPDWLKKWVKQ